jgi:hypothetical protein
MAQGALVADLIDDGWNLISQLRRNDFPITAAWWVKPTEVGTGGTEEWQFFIASPLVDQLGPADAYQKAYDALRSMPSFDPVLARISLGMIKIIGERNRITEDVLKIIRQLHGWPPLHVWHRRLGEIQTEEVYVYPLTLPSPWQQVVLKTDVEVDEPLSPNESQAMSQMMASGTIPVRAGWPRSSIPAGTVVNAQVLGMRDEANPLMLFQTLDGKRRGIVYKNNTEPVQGPGP